jgi:YD repeat-containing protein
MGIRGFVALLYRPVAAGKRQLRWSVVAGVLLAALSGVPAHATSPCWQWRGGTAGFGFLGPDENDPTTAFNDVVAICNANNFCFENNGTAVCGNGFSCSNYALVGSVVFQGFPNVKALGLSYLSTNLQTGATTTGFLGGGPTATPVVAGAFANPNGCQVYVSATPPPLAQCGTSCNGTGDPINPASGGMYSIETDLKSPAGRLEFRRFYNSTDSGNASGLSTGWRHSFSRSISARNAGTGYAGGYVASSMNSSLFNDEATACTSGFAQIKSRVSAWAGATASYTNGVCALNVGSIRIGTLPLLYSSPPTPNPSTLQLVGFDASRDDGQVVSFVLQSGMIAAPLGISLRLQQTANGFTLTDDSDNVETYDSTGKLLSVTTRSGVVQTLSYDSAQRLSTVTDSFGHNLTLSYDSQSRLSSVVRQ